MTGNPPRARRGVRWIGAAVQGALAISLTATAVAIWLAQVWPTVLVDTRLFFSNLPGPAALFAAWGDGEQRPIQRRNDGDATSTSAGPGRTSAVADDEQLARLVAATRVVVRERRPAAPRGDAAEALQAIGRSVGADGDSIVDPCLEFAGTDCLRTALEPFFASLARAETEGGQTRIAVFGNSLIASDRIIDIWRDRMQARFGDAGRGFLLVDRMAPYGGRSRTGIRVRGFDTHNIAQGPIGPWPHGVAGVLHHGRIRSRTEWKLEGAEHALVYWLDHEDAPPIKISIDDDAGQTFESKQDGLGRVVEIAIPPGAERLRLEVIAGAKRRQGPAVVYGASLRRATPGVVVDTFGVVASDSTIFLKEDAGLFAQQLGSMAPDLVTVMLGGNETKRVAWGKSKLDEVRADLHRFLQRIKATTPKASCLVVGPIENVHGRGKRNAWGTRDELVVINTLMHDVALEEACAFFDLFRAMGGSGSLRRLDKRSLLHDDMVHPKGKGLDLPGELVSDALLDAYEASAPLSDTAGVRADWLALTDAHHDPLALLPARTPPDAEWASTPSLVFDLVDAEPSKRALLDETATRMAARLGGAGVSRVDNLKTMTQVAPWSHFRIGTTPANPEGAGSVPANEAVSEVIDDEGVATGGRRCILIADPGSGTKVHNGCLVLDLVEANGGVEVWRARSLVAGSTFTSEGVAAASKLLIGYLLKDPSLRDARPRGRSASTSAQAPAAARQSDRTLGPTRSTKSSSPGQPG